MTLYAARLVLMFELSLYLFAKQKAKQKRTRKQKREAKESLQLLGPFNPSRFSLAPSPTPATPPAHHALRGRYAPPPSPFIRAARSQTCTPTAQTLPSAPIRSPPISAKRRRPASHRSPSLTLRCPLCATRRYAQEKNKMGRASIVAILTKRLGCAPTETRIQN